MVSLKGAKITKGSSKSYIEVVTKSFLCSEGKGKKAREALEWFSMTLLATRSIIR